MELRSYLKIINRRKWIIVATTLIATTIAAVLMYFADPIYVSTTTIRVATIGGNVDGSGSLDINYTERLMNTYSRIVLGRSVTAALMEQFDLNETPTVSVEKIINTELMSIQVEAKDPLIARNVSGAATDILIAKSLELYQDEGQSTREILKNQLDLAEQDLNQARTDYDALLASSEENSSSRVESVSQSIALKEQSYALLLDQYERIRLEEAYRNNSISVIESAMLPLEPAKPRKELNILLGAILGFFGGLGLALVLENLDTTIHSTEQIESLTNLPTVGSIPSTGNKFELIHYDNGHGPQLEAFRRLRINILAATSSLPSTALLVTSAESGEGKSTITANLAVTLAQSGRKVVVVDCNFHSPKIHQLFGVPNTKGLSDLLTKQTSLDDMLMTTQFPRLNVITSGAQMPSPVELVGSTAITEHGLFGQLTQGTELLGSSDMVDLVEQLRTRADVILLDTPALNAVTDAAMMVPLVDNVIMVVARSHSSRDSLRSTYQQLRTVHAKAISLVVNQE